MVKKSQIGLRRGTVKLAFYSSKWKESFEKEKKKIKKALGEMVIDIQHVGSTAVSGVVAKPIIDIVVGVHGLSGKKIDKYIKLFKKLGYKYMGEERPRDHQSEHLFVKGNEKKRLCYLHMVKFDSLIWKNYLLFRDYLRAYKKVRDEYTELKLKLAKKFSNNRKSYTSGKEKFIKNLLKNKIYGF